MISSWRSTALRNMRSATYSSRVRPRTKAVTALAAVSMSHKYARSYFSAGIDDPSRAENPVAPEGVPETFTLNKVDLPAKQARELVLHCRQIPQAPRGLVVERYQNVD